MSNLKLVEITDLTIPAVVDYAFLVAAKSVTGIRTPHYPSAKALHGAFFTPTIYGGLTQGASARRSRIGSSNLFKPATLLIRTDGGSSLKISEDKAMPQNRLLEAQDNFDRLLSQTQALLLVLTANDNFDSVNKHAVANTLWLALDRLDDLGVAYADTVKEVRQ